MLSANIVETLVSDHPNARFEILEILRVKRKGIFHAGEKLAMSLVDRDGTRGWCNRKQISLQNRCIFSALSSERRRARVTRDGLDAKKISPRNLRSPLRSPAKRKKTTSEMSM